MKRANTNRSKMNQATIDNDHQERLSSSSSPSSSSVSPTSSGPYDVFFGRGNGVEKGQGNQHYRRMINAERPRYQMLVKNGEKDQSARTIIAEIRNLGGTFFHRPKPNTSKSSWVPVPSKQLLLKVKQALREIPKVKGKRLKKKRYCNKDSQEDNRETILGDPEPYETFSPIEIKCATKPGHHIESVVPMHGNGNGYASAGATSNHLDYEEDKMPPIMPLLNDFWHPRPPEQDHQEGDANLAEWILETFEETFETRNSQSQADPDSRRTESSTVVSTATATSLGDQDEHEDRRPWSEFDMVLQPQQHAPLPPQVPHHLDDDVNNCNSIYNDSYHFEYRYQHQLHQNHSQYNQAQLQYQEDLMSNNARVEHEMNYGGYGV